MAAHAAGAVTVAVDRHPERLALAERFHALPLHAASAGLPDRIQRLTGGGARVRAGHHGLRETDQRRAPVAASERAPRSGGTAPHRAAAGTGNTGPRPQDLPHLRG